MLKFVETFTKIDHYYCFTDENGKLYYWKSNKSEVYNDCVDCGRLIGINALEYVIKENGKDLNRDGKIYKEIKVYKWEKRT